MPDTPQLGTNPDPEPLIAATADDIWMRPTSASGPRSQEPTAPSAGEPTRGGQAAATVGEPPRDDPPDPLGLEGGLDDIPPRPRRHRSKLTVALAVVVLVAAAFAAGAFANTHWGSSAAASSNTFGRGQVGNGQAGTGTAGAGGGFGRFGGGAIGKVVAVSGNTITVQTAQGTTVKVDASSAQVTRSQPITVSGVKPGDNILVQGSTGSEGTVSAATITVGNLPVGRVGGRPGTGQGGGGQGGGSGQGGGRSPATTALVRRGPRARR